MAESILPTKLLEPPYFPQSEIEDLIFQVCPQAEDHPSFFLQNFAAKLRPAVDKALMAYRQSIYLSQRAESMLPMEQWQLCEIIADNYRAAFHIAEASRTVAKAFYLFLQNMDIEEIGTYKPIYI
jgi:hypothetical protein